MKGFTAILSVGISISLFYFLLIKMIVAGYDPIVACISYVIAVTFITIPLIHGFNKKSVSAILAIIIGYLFSIVIAVLFSSLAQLGTSLFLGAIGALIDTAISISSAIFEAAKEHVNVSFKKIYDIGMEVGKDVLGSMINTLLFAYLASALPFLILISIGQNESITALISSYFFVKSKEDKIKVS